jgi:hypothetical protein
VNKVPQNFRSGRNLTQLIIHLFEDEALNPPNFKFFGQVTKASGRPMQNSIYLTINFMYFPLKLHLYTLWVLFR